MFCTTALSLHTLTDLSSPEVTQPPPRSGAPPPQRHHCQHRGTQCWRSSPGSSTSLVYTGRPPGKLATAYECSVKLMVHLGCAVPGSGYYRPKLPHKETCHILSIAIHWNRGSSISGRKALIFPSCENQA
eukprot:TRINITY_DN5040_c0_g1_i1.p1 TRINITY_DN5040_c0_g1~~TRINITY_DN5040_c0_g1_i1.p1  ORF type:complete len:130 (-),score=24.93 TRINITY_DN5040_c0_g1_i1:297-686(-)